MQRSELDQIRQLIRERNRLPEAPAPRWPELPMIWNLEAGGGPAAAEAPSAPEPAPVAAEPPAERVDATQAEPEAAVAADLAPEASDDEAWRPDEVVHRLVELLMDMRALAGVAAPQTTADRAAA